MLPVETYGVIWLFWCSSFDQLLEIGLINHPHGRDAFCRRLIFPCRQHEQIANLYGRSIARGVPPPFAAALGKGGLFAWESVSRFSTRNPRRRAVSIWPRCVAEPVFATPPAPSALS